MATLKNWQKEHRNELLSLIQNSSKDEKTVNEFYTVEHKGYVLWIGKNARSNDKIVQKSHKEDIWLHARGVSGSHVIIRMNNSKEMPDKRIIEEVAQFAAYQSKAKGAGLAPVIYTKRKYIRKPKGSAYGAVIVQKEQVVIIEPKNPFK
jgi:predicted ribosome quality control (RQC) complex YloA/Tae2 family protein